MKKNTQGITDRDKALVAKIKPKLRQYVINKQQRDAVKTVQEQIDYREKINNLQSLAKDIIKRAEMLSDLAFRVRKLWIAYPPAVSMSWLRKAGTSPALEWERKQDMWAFAKYLFTEFFRNYMTQKDQPKGYPNPMKEENLSWFWLKFNADLRLLIEAYQRRVNAGNKGVIIEDKKL